VGLHGVIDSHAALHPGSEAVIDTHGSWTYSELRAASLCVSNVLRAHGVKCLAPPSWSTFPDAPRPLAVAMPRGREFLAICVGAWRLGVPVVALSDDMPDKEVERARAERVAQELRPSALIVQGEPGALPGMGDCTVLRAESFWAKVRAQLQLGEPSDSVTPGLAPENAMCYVYTGGTTKHSKCVTITHAMALWEMAQYAVALQHSVVRGDRMLQYSSSYWGAAVFGQLDLSLAFGACSVMIPTQPGVDWIAKAVAEYRISVLGIVPSQLRGAYPGGPDEKPACVRVMISWAEKLPVKLAKQWKARVTLFELLIASEYWLTLHSDCSVWRDPADGNEKFVLHALPTLDMQLLREDGSPAGVGEVGEMFLSGPTVSPGYVGPDGCVGTGPENTAAFVTMHGRRYYRSRDRLRRLHGGGLVYVGRADSLTKRGGAWVDLDASEAKLLALPSVSDVALVSGESLDAFVRLDGLLKEPVSAVLGQIQSSLGGSCRVHLRTELPLHPATSKVDRKQLARQVADKQAREAQHALLLSTNQWRMLRSYISWYVPLFVLLAVPSCCVNTFGRALMTVLARLLTLPYLWGAYLYTVKSPTWDRRFWGWPVFPLDCMLLVAALVPASCLGALTAVACAVLHWGRDNDKTVTGRLAALGLLLLLGAKRGAFSPLTSMGAAAFGVGLVVPWRARFFSSLPVCCYLTLSKWAGDEWPWRMATPKGLLRRLLGTLLVPFPRPVWEGYIHWDEKRALVDWGDEAHPTNVILTTQRNGLALGVDYWEEPVSATVQMSDDPSGNVVTSPLASTLLGLLERAGGSSRSLTSLDSLQAINLVELIRKEVGLEVSVRDVLKSSSIEELEACVKVASSKREENVAETCDASTVDDDGLPDKEGAYRVYIMQFPRSPVDWCVRFEGREHLNVEALQRACDRLVAHHSALRTVASPDEPMRDAMDTAAAMWQLWTSCFGLRAEWPVVSRIVSKALFACWPRTVLRSAVAARVRIRVPPGPRVREESWDNMSDDDYALSTVRELCRGYRWPMEIAVVPMYKGAPGAREGADAAEIAASLPREEVSWYIYAGITHAYSDGSSGRALFGDLLRYYQEEVGLTPCSSPVRAPEHLEVLQRRLRKSLVGRPPGEFDPNNDVYHEIVCEDFGKRYGLQRRVTFNPSVFRALRVAASNVLGCSVDVAWLTAVSVAMFRLFPDIPTIRFILKTGCRDGPGEAQMVGFLSEQRTFAVDVGDLQTATVAHVANIIADTRRMRAWRAPMPFEAGLCIYTNIVSAMVDCLPLGCQHVTRQASTPATWTADAYCHLNLRLDQLDALKWDFRIFHWDSAFGWEWGSYFAVAMGAAIHDMVVSPNGPLLKSVPVRETLDAPVPDKSLVPPVPEPPRAEKRKSPVLSAPLAAAVKAVAGRMKHENGFQDSISPMKVRRTNGPTIVA